MSVPVTVTLDDLALDALDSLADRTGSSRDLLIAHAIEAYVTQSAWQLRKINAGIAAAEKGDFAKDEEVGRVRAKFASPT